MKYIQKRMSGYDASRAKQFPKIAPNTQDTNFKLEVDHCDE